MSYSENIRRARSSRAQISAAREIHEGLEAILLAGGDRAARRWCWELLQNARDAGRPEGVRVRFTLEEGPAPALTFLHDGAPFTTDDLVGLVEKDSTKRKPPQSNRRRPIGKFGTGFLTTHLLTRRVEVAGLVHDPGEPIKAITIPLDRTGDDVESLQAGVEASFAALDDIERAPHVDAYDPRALNTRFTYHLDGRGLEVARVGFDDLTRLLPMTLAFVDGIASVEIEHLETRYRVGARRDVGEGLHVVAIHVEGAVTDTVHEFLVAEEGDTTIAVPVGAEGAELGLRPLGPEIPRLFCGFPLVGSEGFPLPVAISSPELHPTEKRDGVVLGDADHYKPKENRARFETEVVTAYGRLLESASGWADSYVLAGLRSGEAFDWLDSAWYDNKILSPLRERALRSPLVEMDRGAHSAIVGPHGELLVRIPTGKTRDVQEEIWDLARPLMGDELPKRAHVDRWRERVWTDEYDLAPAHLLLLAAHGDLAGLANAMGTDTANALAWVRHLVAFLRENDLAHYLDPFKATVWVKQIWTDPSKPDTRSKKTWAIEDKPVLPDQHGQFRHARDLHVAVGLDEALKDVAARLGDDVRAVLLHDDVDIQDPAHKAMEAADLAARIEKLVYKKVHDGDDSPATRAAFSGLLDWFDANPVDAEHLFARLYHEQHLLQTAEEARALRQKAVRVDGLERERDELSAANVALREEVDALRAQLSKAQQEHSALGDESMAQARHYAETWIKIKEALGQLGTAEASITATDLQRLLETRSELFDHVSKSSREAYVAFRMKLERAKARVREALEKNPLYDASGWREVPDFPTIIEGVRRRGVRAESWHPPHPITLVVRPSDDGFIVLYDPEERAVLATSDSELWIEGDGERPERLTLGGFADRLGINRIPLRIPVGKPAVLYLS